MRTGKLTSEECERLNTEERMYLNRYAENAKRIMKKPVGERYSMLSNLCKMIIEDQSDWIDNDTGMIFSTYCSYLKSCLPIEQDLTKHIIMICSDPKEFDKVCGQLYEETPEIKYFYTSSELAITLLLGSLYSALSIEEEISWVEGKISTPPTKSRYKLSAEDVESINNMFGGSNNDNKKVLLDKKAVTESDKKLNVQIDRYNKHAQSILLNQSAKDRIKPLENLLIIMERENKSLLSDHLRLDVSWTDIDDNGNLINKRGTSDYQRYQFFINKINLRHLFDYELHNEEKAPKSFAELELMFLYCSLKQSSKTAGKRLCCMGI